MRQNTLHRSSPEGAWRRCAAWLALSSVALFACADAIDVRASDLDAIHDGAYVEKRDGWLAELRSDREARSVMEARARDLAWSEASWRSDVVIAAVVAAALNSEVAGPLARLAGLDPRVYLQRRAPRPEVVGELLRARIPAPVLVERYRRLDVLQPWPAAVHYPMATGATDLRAAERVALREGLLHAVGESRHPVAVPFLTSVAVDATAAIDLRRVAVIALGRTGVASASTALRGVLQADARGELAASIMGGAARLRSQAGLALLREGVKHDRREVLRAAVTGLGAFASPRAWHGTKLATAAELRAEAAATLVDLLRSDLDPGLGPVWLEAVAAADHPDGWQTLSVIAADGSATEASRALARQALRYRDLATRRDAR